MMRRSLLSAEMHRLWSRRLMRWAVVAMFALTVALLWQVADGLKPLPEGAISPAQAQCLQAQSEARKTDPAVDFHCDAVPQRAQTGNFAEAVPAQLVTVTYVLLGFALLTGASATGHDLNTGALSTWLMFEPRRIRVLGTKSLAAAIWVVPWAVVSMVGFAVSSWRIHAHYGKASQVRPDDWLRVAVLLGRSLLLVAAVAMLATALALLLKHTGAVLALFSTWALVELLFPQLDSVPWLLLPNVKGWILGGTTYEQTSCRTPDGLCRMQTVQLPVLHSIVYLMAIAGALWLLSAVVFRRRNIA